MCVLSRALFVHFSIITYKNCKFDQATMALRAIVEIVNQTTKIPVVERCMIQGKS